MYSSINSLQDAQNHRKSSYIDLHRLAEIHHRQAVQKRTQKHGYRFVLPSGTGLHRQAVSSRTQKTLTQACAA